MFEKVHTVCGKFQRPGKFYYFTRHPELWEPHGNRTAQPNDICMVKARSIPYSSDKATSAAYTDES